jgi:hypothetical protein
MSSMKPPHPIAEVKLAVPTMSRDLLTAVVAGASTEFLARVIAGFELAATKRGAADAVSKAALGTLGEQLERRLQGLRPLSANDPNYHEMVDRYRGLLERNVL